MLALYVKGQTTQKSHHAKKIIEGFAVVIYLKTDSCTFGYFRILGISIEYSISQNLLYFCKAFELCDSQ